jgi:hypothetical protein
MVALLNWSKPLKCVAEVAQVSPTSRTFFFAATFDPPFNPRERRSIRSKCRIAGTSRGHKTKALA